MSALGSEFDDEPQVSVEPLVRCRNFSGLEELQACLKNPAYQERFVLCEIGWYLVAQFPKYWHPKIAQLFDSAVSLCARALKEPILCENDSDLKDEQAAEQGGQIGQNGELKPRRKYRNCIEDDIEEFWRTHGLTQAPSSSGDGEKSIPFYCTPRSIPGAWLPCFCYDDVHWKLGETLLEIGRIGCALEKIHQDEVEQAEAARMLLLTANSEQSKTKSSGSEPKAPNAAKDAEREIDREGSPAALPIVRQQLLDDEDLAAQQALLDALNADDDDDNTSPSQQDSAPVPETAHPEVQGAQASLEDDHQVQETQNPSMEAKSDTGAALCGLAASVADPESASTSTSSSSSAPVPSPNLNIAIIFPEKIMPGPVDLNQLQVRIQTNGFKLKPKNTDKEEHSDVPFKLDSAAAELPHLSDKQEYVCDIRRDPQASQFEFDARSKSSDSNLEPNSNRVSVAVYYSTQLSPHAECFQQAAKTPKHTVPSGWIPYYGGSILIDEPETPYDQNETGLTALERKLSKGLDPATPQLVVQQALERLSIAPDTVLSEYQGDVRVECPILMAAGCIPPHAPSAINEAINHADTLFLTLQHHLVGILTPDANDVASLNRCAAATASSHYRASVMAARSERERDQNLLERLRQLFGDPPATNKGSKPTGLDSIDALSHSRRGSEQLSNPNQTTHPIPSHGSKCALRLSRWARALTACSDWRLMALQEEIARGGSGNNHTSVVLASDAYKLYLRATKLVEYAIAPYLLAMPEPCPPSEPPTAAGPDGTAGALPYSVPYVTPYRYAYRGFCPETMTPYGPKHTQKSHEAKGGSGSDHAIGPNNMTPPASFSNFAAFSSHAELGMNVSEFHALLVRLRPDLFASDAPASIRVVPTPQARAATCTSAIACSSQLLAYVGENVALYWNEVCAEHLLRIHAAALDGMVATRLLCPGAASASAYPNGYAAYFWNVPYILHQFVSGLRRVVLRHPLPALRPLVALMLSRSRYVAASAVRVLDDVVRLAAAFKGALRAYSGCPPAEDVVALWNKAVEAGINAKSQAEYARAIAAGQQQDALSWTRAVIESVPPQVAECIGIFAKEQQQYCQQRGLQWDLTRAFIEAWDVCCNAVYFATGHRLPAATHMDRRGRPFRRGRLNPYRFRLRSPQSSFRHTLKEANDMVSHATFLSLVIKQDPRLLFTNWEKVGQGAFGDVYSATVISENSLPGPPSANQRKSFSDTSDATKTPKLTQASPSQTETAAEEQDNDEQEGVLFNPFDTANDADAVEMAIADVEHELISSSSYIATSTTTSSSTVYDEVELSKPVQQQPPTTTSAGNANGAQSSLASVVRSVAAGAANLLSSAAEGLGLSKQASHSNVMPERDDDPAGKRMSAEEDDAKDKERSRRKRRQSRLRHVKRPQKDRADDTDADDDSKDDSTPNLLQMWGDPSQMGIEIPSHIQQRLANLGRSTGERIVAIKQVQIDGPESWGAGEKETLTLSACSHPNVVSYLGTYHADNSLWLVMDFCDGGTLAQFCYHNPLDEPSIAYICREVVSGLHFLHQRKRVHRDLKPANILLHLDGRVRIGDLGLLVDIEDGAPRSSLAGTENFMAPEMISGSGYDGKVDIWSLGCSLLEICNGKAPYKSLSTMSCLFRLATDPPPTLNRPGDWSPELRHFLNRCLEKDPHRRASAAELLEHSFIARAAPRSQLAARFVQVFVNRTLKAAGLI